MKKARRLEQRPHLGWSVCPVVPVAQPELPERVVPPALAAHSSQFKNNYFAEMCSGSDAGSYLRRIDFCITQL